MDAMKKITGFILDIKWNNRSFYVTIFSIFRFGLNCGKDTNYFSMISVGLLWFDLFMTLQFRQTLTD